MSVFEVSAVFQAVDHMTNIVENISNAIVGLGRTTVGMAIEFNASSAMMGTAFSEVGIDAERLSEAALAVGKDTRLLGVNASQSAEAITTLGRAGMDTASVFGDLNGYMNEGAQLGGVLRASLDLAAGSTLSIGDAANLSVQMMTTFGREMETAAQKSEFINSAMDTIVRAANASVAEVGELAWSLKYVGREAVQAGMSLETTAAALGILSNAGITGSRAGTQLRAVMNSLITPTDKAKDALEQLGITIYDSTGTMRYFPDIMEDMRVATMNMTNEQRASVLSMITTKANVGTLTDMVMAGAAGFEEMTNKMAGAVGLQSQMEIRAQTVGVQIDALRGNLETLGIGVGTTLLPALSLLIGTFSELVEKQGPAIEAFAAKFAGGVQTMAEGLGPLINAILTMDPVISSSIVQLAGLALAVSGGIKVWGLLSGAITTVVPVLASIGGGLSAASVSSLGLTAALGPVAAGFIAIAAPLAAVVALVIAYNTAVQFNKDIQAQTAEVTNSWTGFLQEQVDTQTTAIGVADAYAEAQERVNAAYNEGGAVATTFIDRQAVLNAGQAELAAALVGSASSYDDYVAAIKRVNESVAEQATRTNWLGAQVVDTKMLIENSVWALDEYTFSVMRNSDAFNANELATLKARTATRDLTGEFNAATGSGFTQWMKSVGGTTLKAGNEVAVSAESFATLSEIFTGLKREAEEYNPALTTLQKSMGATTPFVDEQTAALELLTLAYQQGKLAPEDYAIASQRVIEASNETGTGLQSLTSTVDNATGGMYGLGTSIDGLPGKMGLLVEAQLRQAQTAEEMQSRATAAWNTMATNVQTAVGNALTAYKTGNAEMLAEQQRALGELALGQIQQWGAMEVITETQMQAMSAAVRSEFGIMSSDVQVGTDVFLGILSRIPTEGQTAIDELIGYIRNIGPETEEAVAQADQALLNQMAVYGELAGVTGLMGGQVAANIDLMASGVEGSAARAVTGLETVKTGAETMAGGVEGAAGRASTAIDKIGKAINTLPSYKDIDIRVRYTAEGKPVEFGSPDFNLLHAIERVVKYAEENPIRIHSEYIEEGTNPALADSRTGTADGMLPTPSPPSGGGEGKAATGGVTQSFVLNYHGHPREDEEVSAAMAMLEIQTQAKVYR